MSVNYYDKQTKQLYGVAGSSRTWIGSKAAHDAEAISEKLPNNVLLAILNTGLFYRDGTGTETAITQGGGSDIQKVVMPTASSDEEGSIYQYIGLTDTTLGFTHGFFYECVDDGAGGYEWVNLDVMAGSGSSIQVSVLPTAGITELGKVYQYLGSDTVSLKHGYFYECVYNDPNYEWVNINVQAGGSGDTATPITAAELEAMWN